MFPILRNAARQMARDAARKAAFGSAAGLCLLVGAGFLLSAAWIALAAANGALFASLVIGLALAGLGLVLLAVAMAGPRRKPSRSRLAEDIDALDDEALAALNRAAAGGPGDMERALRGLLTEAGLAPPATGNAPALAAAFVFGVTLALSRRRKR